MSDLAAQAGLVLHNIGLTDQLRARLAELQASRLRIVTAATTSGGDERDIHDGAQQQLLAIADTLAAARSLAGQDQGRERALVDAAQGRDERRAGGPCANSPAASTRRCSPTRACPPPSAPRPARHPGRSR